MIQVKVLIHNWDFNIEFSYLPVNSVVLSIYPLTDPISKPRDNLYIGIDSTVDDIGSKTKYYYTIKIIVRNLLTNR